MLLLSLSDISGKDNANLWQTSIEWPTSIDWPPAKGGHLMGGQLYYIILKTAKSGLVSKWGESKLHYTFFLKMK